MVSLDEVLSLKGPTEGKGERTGVIDDHEGASLMGYLVTVS